MTSQDPPPPKAGRPSAADDAKRQEAQAILRRAAADSEGLLGSSLRRAGNHFAARSEGDVEAAGDPIELWGRRIGRALSLVAFVLLAFWLGRQLRLW